MIRTFKEAMVLLCALGIASQAMAAPSKTQSIPGTITTQKGKTYYSASLVRAEPDGLVIEYRPEIGGFGMTKLKFRDLPDNLRQQFNYDEGVAEEFAAARFEANQKWKNGLLEAQKRQTQAQVTQAQFPAAIEEPMGMQYPVGRFEARGTIRGAMILDTVTGEAWLVDLHSVLQDYQQGYFVQPKVPMPAMQTGNAVIIGP